MKKVWLLLLALMLILPGAAAFAQQDSLPSSEIDRISNSVVLILAMTDGEVVSTGSGTIIESTGVIYTNRHVVEDADDYAILMIRDLGELPELRYYATPTLVHPTIDFAVLQIDRDNNNRRIEPNTLNLPTISLANTLPSIGETVFVFGFPGIGDGYMVLTRGSITTIQNETVDGDRIPFWYQTDAQISPGNSGGLVVNGQGLMVGIPTQVRSEDRTLGRLGGILSVSAVRAALSSMGVSVVIAPTQVPQQPDTETAPQPTGTQELIIEISRVDHAVELDDTNGMRVHMIVNALGYRGQDLRIGAFMFWDDDEPIVASNRAPDRNRTGSGHLTMQEVLTPQFDHSVWEDLWFFIPYNSFPDGGTGTRGAYIEAQLGIDGEPFSAFSNTIGFEYTFAERQLIIDIDRIEHNVTVNNLTGMRVHSRINTIGHRDGDIRVGLFLYWEDGTAIPGTNAPSDFRTSSGNLTVQDVLRPQFDNTVWDDFWFFVPYNYFPSGLSGTQPAFAQVEIGIDGQPFASWSLSEDFELNYN